MPSCIPKCSSKSHIDWIRDRIRHGSLHDCLLALSDCHNALRHKDSNGRLLLHYMCRDGKLELVRSLVESCGGSALKLNQQDDESGWTPLHFAIYSGHLALANYLLEQNVSRVIRDRDGLTAFDLVGMDRAEFIEFSECCYDIYSWGDNTNFNLGHTTEQSKHNPEIIEFFRREKIHITQVAMSRYHTVFLTDQCMVYVCGHGRGGRLGLSNDRTVLIPELVSLEPCTMVSCSKNHTLFLTDSAIYACGYNDCSQFGILPENEMKVPTKLNYKALKGQKILGVVASRLHTVVWSPEFVYTCGQNVGQLGHAAVDALVAQPRCVTSLIRQRNNSDRSIKICSVKCSNSATAVLNEDGDVHLLFDFQCKRLPTRGVSPAALEISGGNISARDNLPVEDLKDMFNQELLVLIYSASPYQMFIWRQFCPILRRIYYCLPRHLDITSIALGGFTMAFTTRQGEAFVGTIPKVAKTEHRNVKLKASYILLESIGNVTSYLTGAETSLNEILQHDWIEVVQLSRLPNVHRADKIFCDPAGRNFAVLQGVTNAWLTDIPFPEPNESLILSQLLHLQEDADLTDAVHDVVLEVGSELIPAHKYILALRSDYFRKRLTGSNANVRKLSLSSVNQIDLPVFRDLLNFIYSNSSDILSFSLQSSRAAENVCTCASRTRKGTKKHSKKLGKVSHDNSCKCRQFENSLQRLTQLAIQFGVKSFAQKLSNQNDKLTLKQKSYPELYDVKIQCPGDSGVLCHACVLVARLEYFRTLFATRWIGQTSFPLKSAGLGSCPETEKPQAQTNSIQTFTLPIPKDVLLLVIEYMYSGEFKINCSADSEATVELLCNILSVADHLLFCDLKSQCESTLAPFVSLRNVVEIMELCLLYNAPNLRNTCAQFICLNLTALFEVRSLCGLSPENFQHVEHYYQNMVRDSSPNPRTFCLRSTFQSEFLDTGESDMDSIQVITDCLQKTSIIASPNRSEIGMPVKKSKQRLSSESEGVKKSKLASVNSQSFIEDKVSCQAGIIVNESRRSFPDNLNVSANCMISPQRQDIVLPSDLNTRVPRPISLSGLDEFDRQKPKFTVLTAQRTLTFAGGGRQDDTAEASALKSPRSSDHPWGKEGQFEETRSVKPSLREVMQSEQFLEDSRYKVKRSQSSKSKLAEKRKTEQTAAVAAAPSPWGKLPSPESPRFPTELDVNQGKIDSPSFSDIISEQRMQHDAGENIRKKPLSLIQIEERAIVEISDLYKVEEAADEWITVERVSTSIAPPVWAAHLKLN